jgi:hypothetical protein
MTVDPVKRCRSCAAPILFARLASDPDRRANPIDANPAEHGNILLFSDGVYLVLNRDEIDRFRLAGVPLYVSHFATCPDHKKFRVPRAVKVDERLL